MVYSMCRFKRSKVRLFMSAGTYYKPSLGTYTNVVVQYMGWKAELARKRRSYALTWEMQAQHRPSGLYTLYNKNSCHPLMKLLDERMAMSRIFMKVFIIKKDRVHFKTFLSLLTDWSIVSCNTALLGCTKTHWPQWQPCKP